MTPDFEDGLKNQLILDTVTEASSTDRWVKVKRISKGEAS